ncbi:hypothetical protein GCM10012287_41140 [Streptomyces daqingensis]|uniref:Uncharacterized protein n=1 Tax=Streptomyces daqingensis TaxID=1472640 RepID=A0ABQ2MJJ0_9ACTN|nr:hypothetical protein GCM10012287_41140 [Streptomyces daqingensis]
MRVYVFNPNNDSGQDWGDGVVVSTAGNGERFGEASLPFDQFASRLHVVSLVAVGRGGCNGQWLRGLVADPDAAGVVGTRPRVLRMYADNAATPCGGRSDSAGGELPGGTCRCPGSSPGMRGNSPSQHPAGCNRGVGRVLTSGVGASRK